VQGNGFVLMGERGAAHIQAQAAPAEHFYLDMFALWSASVLSAACPYVNAIIYSDIVPSSQRPAMFALERSIGVWCQLPMQ
jgi:hypothetical protein